MFAPFAFNRPKPRAVDAGGDTRAQARSPGGAQPLVQRLAASARPLLQVMPAPAPAVAPAVALSRAAARLSTAGTLDELRDFVAGAVGSVFKRIGWLELFLVGPGGALEPAVHPVDDEAQESRQLIASLRNRLRSTRAPLSAPQVLAAAQTSGRRSAMTAPLLDLADDLRGLLVVEARAAAPDFTATDLVALEGIAALASAALLRLTAREAERTRARRELDRAAACRIQRGFMSSSLPPDAGVVAVAEYLPAFEVGGDFFSVKRGGEGTVWAAIGDVSGNGVSAALVMARVASDLERALGEAGAPSAVLDAVNGRLAAVDTDMFVTAACVRVDTRRRRLTIANAGHPPIVVRRPDGDVFTFGGASGVPLGVAPCAYGDEELVVGPDDILLLFTDGLLEALDHPSGHRGMELLLDLVGSSAHDLAELNARIRAELGRAQAEHALDDVTWVGLQLAT